MKKGIFAICMAALMLTGCGNSAGTAQSSTPAADASSATVADSEQADSVSETESAEESADQEQEFIDWFGIEIPIPSGMERCIVGDEYVFSNEPHDTRIDNPVYFAFENAYPEKDEDGNYKIYTAAEVPDAVWVRMNDVITPFYLTNAGNTKKNVESTSEATFLDNPVLCEHGTLQTVENVNLHYVAYYTAVEFPKRNKGRQFPIFWIAFTPSDDPEALELMERAAEAPLKEAKLQEN